MFPYLLTNTSNCETRILIAAIMLTNTLHKGFEIPINLIHILRRRNEKIDFAVDLHLSLLSFRSTGMALAESVAFGE